MFQETGGRVRCLLLLFVTTEPAFTFELFQAQL